MAMTLALVLAGCSWVGGEPTEAERLAERLAQPPDVLSDARAGGASTPTDTGAGADRDGIEVVGTRIETDPESALSVINGVPVLDLGLPLDAGWAVVGRALDRSGFELVGSDRDEHLHMIRYDTALPGDAVAADDDGDLIDWLAFWRDEQGPAAPRDYRIEVTERGKGTRVSVLRPDGEPAPRVAARQVLAVLAEQLKP